VTLQGDVIAENERMTDDNEFKFSEDEVEGLFTFNSAIVSYRKLNHSLKANVAYW